MSSGPTPPGKHKSTGKHLIPPAGSKIPAAPKVPLSGSAAYDEELAASSAKAGKSAVPVKSAGTATSKTTKVSASSTISPSASTSKTTKVSASSKTSSTASPAVDSKLVSRPAFESTHASNIAKVASSVSTASSVPVVTPSAEAKSTGKLPEALASSSSTSTGKIPISTSYSDETAAARSKKWSKPPKYESLSLPRQTSKSLSVAAIHSKAALDASRSRKSSSSSSESEHRGFRTGSAPGTGGLGVFATKEFAPGDTIIRERPVIIIHDSEVLSYDAKVWGSEDYMGDSCKRRDMAYTANLFFQELNEEDQKEFLSLAKSISPSMRNEFSKLAKDISEDPLLSSKADKGDSPYNWLRLSIQKEIKERKGVDTFRDVADAWCTNAVAGGGDDMSMVCLRFSRTNHSCQPNGTYSFDPDTIVLNVIAMHQIRKGEQIFVAYTPYVKDRGERQEHLKAWYGFDCRCVVCIDDSPMGEALEKNRRAIGDLRDYLKNAGAVIRHAGGEGLSIDKQIHTSSQIVSRMHVEVDKLGGKPMYDEELKFTQELFFRIKFRADQEIEESLRNLKVRRLWNTALESLNEAEDWAEKAISMSVMVNGSSHRDVRYLKGYIEELREIHKRFRDGSGKH